jgi:hypothetical protein
MNPQILENIDQAFLQLEYVIKMMAYTELKKINKEELDSELIILGDKRNLNFAGNKFNSYDDLILASQNETHICFGFTSIVLDLSLDAIGIERNPKDNSEKGMIRNLIYMIRCSYAHDMMHPKWEVKGDFRKVLKVPLTNCQLEIDLTEKHGQPFDFSDIGGFENYFEIKDKVREIIIKS